MILMFVKVNVEYFCCLVVWISLLIVLVLWSKLKVFNICNGIYCVIIVVFFYKILVFNLYWKCNIRLVMLSLF